MPALAPLVVSTGENRRQAIAVGVASGLSLLIAASLLVGTGFVIVSQYTGTEPGDGWFVLPLSVWLLSPYCGWLACRRTLRVAQELQVATEQSRSRATARYVASRRRGAIVIGLAAGLLTGFVLPLPFVFASTDVADAQYLLLALAFAPPVGGLAYLRAARLTGVALWLRPFHRSDSRHLDAIVREACRGVGRCITLQDTVVRRSLIAGIASQWIVAALAAPLWLSGGVAFAVVVLGGLSSIVSYDSAEYERLVPGVLAASFVVWTFGSCVYLLARVRRYGVVALVEPHREAQVGGLLSRIRRGLVFPGGVHILQCTDDFWRRSVTLVMRESDVIIVDVTEITDNIVWEISQALSLVPAERVVLVYHAETDAQDGFPSDLFERLARQLPHDLRTCSRLVIGRGPSRQPRTRIAMEELRGLVQAAMSERPRTSSIAVDGREAPFDIDGWLRLPVGELYVACLLYGSWAAIFFGTLIGSLRVDLQTTADVSTEDVATIVVWYFAKFTILGGWGAGLIRWPLRRRARAFVRLTIGWYAARISLALIEAYALIVVFRVEIAMVIVNWLTLPLAWLGMAAYLFRSRRARDTFRY